MKLLIIAAALAAFTATAQVPVTIDTWFSNPNLYGGTVSVSYGGEAFRTVNAGQLLATTPSKSFVTYCTDLNNILNNGYFTPIPIGLATDPAHQNPDWSVGGIERAVKVVRYFGDRVDTAVEAVSLQTLVWEVLYDNPPDVTGGLLKIQDAGTPGVTALVQAWYQEPGWAATPTDGSVWLMPSTPTGDYRTGQGLIDAPEPGTWAAGVGLIGLTGLTLWRQKRRLA